MKWLDKAWSYNGVTEVPGKDSNPTIQGWLHELKVWWTDDATPWCGVFAAHCVAYAGLPVPKAAYRAKEWINWGAPLAKPVVGCVVVFSRNGGGHVGFVVGVDQNQNLMVLGGNQKDKVCVMAFSRSRAVAYRWPVGVPISKKASVLPVLSPAELSVNEA